MVPDHRLVLVHHPRHDLRRGVDVGGGNVDIRPNQVPDLPHIAARKALELAGAHLLRVADHATLATAERNIDERRFPGHPRRQGADGIDRLLWMEPDTSLAGPASVVVLNAV